MKLSTLSLVLSSFALSGSAVAGFQGLSNNLDHELQNELRIASMPHPVLDLSPQQQPIALNSPAKPIADEIHNEFVQLTAAEQTLQPPTVKQLPELQLAATSNLGNNLASLAAAHHIQVNAEQQPTDALQQPIEHIDHDAQVNFSETTTTPENVAIQVATATSEPVPVAHLNDTLAGVAPETEAETKPASTPTGAQDDKLQQLTRALAAGQYQPEVTPLTPAEKQQELDIKIRSQQAKSQVIEFNNDTINRKYPVAQASFSGSINRSSASWMEKYPLPKNVGRVSSTFGTRVMAGRVEHHQGLDLAAPTGTPIYATGSGVVTKAGWGNGYGQYVEINHGNGYLTRYGHASRVNVQVGDRIEAGDHIANVGCTGRCTGPHLHYEVVKDGERRNPASYLALLP